MRIRALLLVALVALPSVMSAQRIGRPRIFRRPEPPPAPLPPQPAIVANQEAYQRSKWSFESAPVVTHIEMPGAGGGTAVYTTLGTADHADYRVNDRYAATMDVTGSLDGPTLLGTVEAGTRYRPVGLDMDIRPYVDLRAEYMYMYDTYVSGLPGTNGIGVSAEGSRYARGFGALAGAGFEYTLTRTLSLTTEVSAMRNRLHVFRMTGPAELPASQGRYWTTAVRYTLGLKYNAVHVLHAVQQAVH